MVVATALTACGIETCVNTFSCYINNFFVATALTACGIETLDAAFFTKVRNCVATALTACGIETGLLQSQRLS